MLLCFDWTQQKSQHKNCYQGGSNQSAEHSQNQQAAICDSFDLMSKLKKLTANMHRISLIALLPYACLNQICNHPNSDQSKSQLPWNFKKWGFRHSALLDADLNQRVKQGQSAHSGGSEDSSGNPQQESRPRMIFLDRCRECRYFFRISIYSAKTVWLIGSYWLI